MPSRSCLATRMLLRSITIPSRQQIPRSAKCFATWPWLLTMPSDTTKRPASRDASISPPPVKRRMQSNISKGAVASFFTPTSQKPKIDITWTERAPTEGALPTLLVAKYKVADGARPDGEPSVKRRKIAAFDLDSTLITSASGKKFGKEPGDWKWWDRSVPQKLRDLYINEGYRVVVFTNQGGLTLHADLNAKGPKPDKSRVTSFKEKCAFVLADLDLPLTLYAATGKDKFRKPRSGMWTEMLADYGLDDASVEHEHSWFVGDAGGRTSLMKDGKAVPKDFSCSDRNLAHNIGIAFRTPEEFFLDEPPRNFTRTFDLADHPFDQEHEKQESDLFVKKNDKDIVLFCGPPGAGKSTFFWRHLKPAGYQRVNQDLLKSKDKCLKAANDFLQQGESVAVDNTNADPDTRSAWVDLAKKNNVPIRCIRFNTPIEIAEHNDAVRSMNEMLNPESRTVLPKLAFNGFFSRLKEPKMSEGFQDITQVEFKFRGTAEEYAAWGRYWT